MSTSYKLSFVPQALQLHAKAKVYRINVSSKLYANHNGALISCEYANGNWNQIPIDNDINVRGVYAIRSLGNRKPLLIVKTERGLRFYQQNGNQMKILLKTDNFEDDNYFDDRYYDWDTNALKIGHIYSNPNFDGIIAKNDNGLKIFAIMKDKLESDDEYPIIELKTNYDIFGNIGRATIALSDIKKSGYENIIVHGESGLNIYRINENLDVERQTQIPNSGKADNSSEQLFFPNLTGQSQPDIVVLNDTGLFVYQYTNQNSNYQMINYAPSFSKLNGWLPEHREFVRFEDIDLDGRQDMIFTGPQGIKALTFETNKSKWKSLLDNSDLTAVQRYSNVMEVIPGSRLNTQYPWIMAKYQDKVYAAKIEAVIEKLEPHTTPAAPPLQPSPTASTGIIPPIDTRMSKSEWSPTLLQDQLDYSEIYKAIGNTGTPSFHLALVDLSARWSNLRFNVIYDGSDKTSDLLGIGWSFPHNSITVFSPSIYPEDDAYYLMLDGSQYQLTLKPKASNDNVHVFEVPNKRFRMIALYYKNEEKWEIKSKHFEQVYGGDQNGGVTWSQKKYLREQRYANVWHLIRSEDKQKNALQYMYESINIPRANGKLGQEVYLKSINDMNDNKIVFNYSDKNRSEYSPNNSDGRPIRTRYLNDYIVTTSTYQQIIQFFYETDNKNRWLTKIQQIGDVSHRPVLQFAYAKISDAYPMQKVTLPSGANIEFESKLQKTVPAHDANKITCDVESDYRVGYGSDYTIVTYIDVQGRAAVRIYSPDMTEELCSPFMYDPSKKLPYLGKGWAKSYDVYMFQHFVAIVLAYEKERELYLLRRNGSRWIITPTLYTYNEKSVFQSGKDFVIVADVHNSAIEAITWHKGEKKWEKIKLFNNSHITEESLILTVSGRFVLNVSSNVLMIAYQDSYHQWQQNQIQDIPNIMNEIRETMRRFDVDGEAHNMMFNFLKKIALRVSDNLILLNRWRIDGTQIYSEIEAFVLDSSYKVAKREPITIRQDDLSTFSTELDDQNGSTYTIGYKLEKNKFKITLKGVRGKKITEFEQIYENRSMRRVQLKKYLEQQEQQDGLRNSFPLEMRKYIADFLSNQIVCNNRYFTFTGNSWEEDTQASNQVQFDDKSETFSIPLGKKFVLNKTDAGSSVRLHKYKNDADKLGDLIVDLNVMHLNQIVLRYPSYLAYKTNNQLNVVIRFSNDGNIADTYELPAYENISESGSSRTLVTSNDRGSGKTLTFRHQYDIDRLPYNVVTTQTVINLEDGTKRIMGFEYGKAIAYGETVLYEKVVKIPYNDKSVSGWTEETVDFKTLSALNKHTYNSNGELVKTLKADGKSSEDNDNNDQARLMEEHSIQRSTLLDRTGNLRIAQTFPHRRSDGDIGYFGFEDYEHNEIGHSSAKKWEFDVNKVVKNEFSFTGQNFLRLTNEILKADFELGNKNQPYIVSCWVRPQNGAFNLGQTIPYIRATISAKGQNDSYSDLVAGEVKFKSGDWFYVELALDLYYARETLKTMRKIDTNRVAVEFYLVTSIIVAPSDGIILDVDHIRFAPLSNAFAVNVYDTKHHQLKEVIGPSGLVERYIHDKYLKKIATISEYGEVKKLETYTKASSVGRMSQAKSKIEIQPETGFYERFASDSFRDRWRIKNSAAWQISPCQLEHVTSSEDTIQLSNELLRKSQGIRFFYNLKSNDAFIQFNIGLRLMHRGENRNAALLLHEERPIPSDGEALIVTEGRRVFVWIDGGLYFDRFIGGSEFDMTFSIGGRTLISELIVFYNPSVTVTYVNAFGEMLQEITLESENVSMVKTYRYDTLGRQTIVTRPMRNGISSQSLLAYHSNVIGNSQEYIEYQYCNNPLNDKCAIGLPGRSVSGAHAKRYTYSPDDLFIQNLYPVDQNYSYQVEHKAGDVKITSVLDDRSNRVAWYLRAPKSKNLLSTYQYDKNGKLIQMLPPAYHTSVNTFHKIIDRLHEDHNREQEEKMLRKVLGVSIVYDEDGRILVKTTPDAGSIENIYNENGLLAFVLHISNGNIQKILYHEYDALDRLRSSGQVTVSVPKNQLLHLKLNSNNSKVLQQFSYNDFEYNPLLRGKVVRMTTFNHGEPFVEESVLNIDEDHISKRVYVQNGNKPDIVAIDKIYRGGKLKQILYPMEVHGKQLSVSYEYDKLGNIVGIGVPGNSHKFVSFTYNPDGHISSETYEPLSVKKFNRRYNYDSAGFLIDISDPFLTESLHYTDGYGSRGYSDGMIARTEFKANWHDNSNTSQLGLNENSFVGDNITPEISSVCFNALKRSGYLNENGRQVKNFYPNLELEMPILCRYGVTGRRIQNVLGKNGFAIQYGHSYDYGNYQELAKAKYFVGNEVSMPLQADSFAREIGGIDEAMSHDIWTRLTRSRYLIDDNHRIGSFLGHGKRGTSFINPALHNDLANMGDDFRRLGLPLENLLMAYFAENRTTLAPSTLLKWNIGTETEKSRHIAAKVVQMLNEKGYMVNPLDREFINILQPYQPFIHDIIRVLFQHLGRALGESEFDTESYKIDVNGNHQLFYTGFDRYELNYHNNKNQIDNIHIRWSNVEPQTFAMKHDHRGNIIQALHKGIQRIHYNPLSNRATEIQLVNGVVIRFYYDARGERVMKKVFDNTDRMTIKVQYTRDEFGRALVERKLTYIRSDLPPDVLVTAYIYGPNGLMGFIRRDQFYSVIKDHEGSIRSVIRNNEVVAAYDYLPYGGLMREFGNDPNAHISYRYTGQEWDEEIGLYNYHARFYDPSIGRFYQIDPAEQYFSPYKYAGNSPVMLVDPDGKFAFLLLLGVAAIVTAGAGAYLGGAAANGAWDPVDWDWKSRNTWLGVVGGGVAGAMLPFGAVGSFGTLTAAGLSAVQASVALGALGVAGAYLSMAAANDRWDATKWDFQSPETWNAMFHGVDTDF